MRPAGALNPDEPMPTPATGTALLILVGFVLPGFVAVLLKGRLYEVRGEESTFDRLLTTVYYSLLIYLLPALVVALLSGFGALDRGDLELFFDGNSSLWLIVLVAAAILLGVPALAAVAAWTWMNSSSRRRVYSLSDRLNPEHRTRWDISSDDGTISRPPGDRHSVGIWIDADEIRLIDHYAMSDDHKQDIEERAPERS